MKTIKINGKIHVYVSENKKLPSLIREIGEIVKLTVPIEFIEDEKYITMQLKKEIKRNYEANNELSWRNNPDKMGY